MRHAFAGVRWPQPVARALLGLCLGVVVGSVASNTLFGLTVAELPVFARALASLLAVLPWTDPVYTRAALNSLADIHVAGLRFGEPPFGAMLQVTLTPGSSVLGRLVAAGVAQCAVLLAGLWLLRTAVHRGLLVLVAAGVGAQVQVALAVLATPPSLTDLETIGLSFAIDVLLPWLTGRRLVVSDLFSGVPPAVVTAGLVAAALLVGYTLAGVFASRLTVLRPRNRALHHQGRIASVASMSAVLALSPILAAYVVGPTSPSPRHRQQTFAPRAVAARPHAGPAVTAARPSPVEMHTPLGDRWFSEPTPASRVEVVVAEGGFRYLVNGQEQIIHGMGINTQYSKLLSPEDRLARLDADLSELQAMGVNTLVGWEPAEFDSVLLSTAQRHAIGVVMPFDLRTDADYLDPEVRADLTRQVLAWVQQYRAYPALRMWGLGNEVLHKIVHPAWVGPQDPHQAAEARAFSDWLIETADAIHAADPNHPVTYRDAEDAFVEWVAAALARHAAEQPRPWFVYGTNCYQDYLSKIVDNWPDQGTGLPLWVSEFAPGGIAIPDRPAGFAAMWGYVRRHPTYILGGAVYAWTRNGPEEIDRNLGLTDDGAPADGGSLAAISAIFTQPR